MGADVLWRMTEEITSAGAHDVPISGKNRCRRLASVALSVCDKQDVKQYLVAAGLKTP